MFLLPRKTRFFMQYGTILYISWISVLFYIMIHGDGNWDEEA